MSSHGEPTVHSAINATISYLQKAKEAFSATSDAKGYASRIKAIFCNRQNPAWVDIVGDIETGSCAGTLSKVGAMASKAARASPAR